MSWRVRDTRSNCVEEIGSSATHASKRTLIHAPWGMAERHLSTPEHLLSSVSQVKWPGKHSTVRPPNCTTPRALGEAAHTHTHTHFPQTPHYSSTVRLSRCWHGVLFPESFVNCFAPILPSALFKNKVSKLDVFSTVDLELWIYCLLKHRTVLKMKVPRKCLRRLHRRTILGQKNLSVNIM